MNVLARALAKTRPLGAVRPMRARRRRANTLATSLLLGSPRVKHGGIHGIPGCGERTEGSRLKAQPPRQAQGTMRAHAGASGVSLSREGGSLCLPRAVVSGSCQCCYAVSRLAGASRGLSKVEQCDWQLLTAAAPTLTFFPVTLLTMCRYGRNYCGLFWDHGV